MIMFVTIFSIWSMIFLGSSLLEYPIPAHSPSSFIIFSPFAFQGWSSSLLLGLWLLWIIALLALLLKAFLTRRNQIPSPDPLQKKEPYLLSLGTPGNVGIFDFLFVALCLLLALIGWTIGNATLLLIGTLATLGLLANSLEQSLSRQ